MALVAGAMGNLAPKLLQLLQDEYKLQKGVKQQVESLAKDLESIHVGLCNVAQVPFDTLDPHVQLWAREAREASYDMENILDTFLVRVHGCRNPNGDTDKGKVNRLVKKMFKKFNISKFKARHEVAGAIEEIKKQVDEMAKRHGRMDKVVAMSSTATSIDPRILMLLDTKACEPVDIDGQKDALIKMLSSGDDNTSDKKPKIVSVVGPGGLGKTTLTKVVYDKLLGDLNINCKAFVPVGRNPDLKKVLRDILIDLDQNKYEKNSILRDLDERQLIKEIQDFLKEKRYLIVIDDVWDIPSCKAIRIALEDNNMGSKIIITTRRSDVAEVAHCTYKMKPLPPESSKLLFHTRIFGSPDRCPEILFEFSDKILKKCDGVPLAIITIASLLANKSNDITEWQEVCDSIGSGLCESSDMYNDMKKILLLSYYDLPSPLKNCFLYLSMYPEDCLIWMDDLIWMWISEGFIQPQRKGDDLFEIGKGYLNDLINRSLVKPVGLLLNDLRDCFRVHDIILDLICSLSRDENFATTSFDIEQVVSSETKKHRRLSLEGTSFWPAKGVTKVRSFLVFGASLDSIPSFSCFIMLRVLNLEDFSLKSCGGFKLYVGNLIHLRYLGLNRCFNRVDIEGIENLQFLHVLETFANCSKELAESIFKLRELICLKGICCNPSSGHLLRNLASLQVLDGLWVGKDPAATVEALGHLTRLTELKIRMETEDQDICDAFIHSLGNLPRLQVLSFETYVNKFIRWERWTPPRQLRVLNYIFSPMLPNWISPSSVPYLVFVEISVHTIGPSDIQRLGMLPILSGIKLVADRHSFFEQPLQKFVVSADAFPRLTSCHLHYVLIAPSTLPRGAMPKVEIFEFYLRAKDFLVRPGTRFNFDDLAMDHLPSLQHVRCNIFPSTDVTKEEAEEKLRQAVIHAAEVHPNHPEHSVNSSWY